MKTIVLDGNMLMNPEVAHPYLKLMMGFPEHYGANLDALHDCLGDLDRMILKITRPAQKTNCYQQILAVMKDSAEESGWTLETDLVQ